MIQLVRRGQEGRFFREGGCGPRGSHVIPRQAKSGNAQNFRKCCRLRCSRNITKVTVIIICFDFCLVLLISKMFFDFQNLSVFF